MPRSIEEGFQDFLSKLVATQPESAIAASHRASIETCLRSHFGLYRFVRIGSFGNGTSISGYSDVDYLYCLPTEELSIDSDYSLQKVRKALNARFPLTGVRVSCPAVVCPFGQSAADTTEIVPADYLGESGGHRVYDIADCDGGWMKASPDAHNEYVRRVNDKHSGMVKPLIRFIKAWKYIRSVPLSSFYLELRVAKYADAEKTIVYDIDVERILCHLRDTELASLRDPMGVSGYIAPCKTSTQKADALSKLRRAATRAEKARLATATGDISGAFDWWRLVYADWFPTYYR